MVHIQRAKNENQRRKLRNKEQIVDNRVNTSRRRKQTLQSRDQKSKKYEEEQRGNLKKKTE